MSEAAMATLAEKLGGTFERRDKTLQVIIPPNRIREACEGVSEVDGLYHLSTITGFDNGSEIELLYHFWKGRSFFVVRTSVKKSSPRLESVTGDLPSALLYEAEVQDLLGVTFEGNPYTGKKLLLPDSYPAEAPPPLTKEADPEKIRRMMELE